MVAAKPEASSSAVADVVLAEPDTERLPQWAREALADASRAGTHTLSAADRGAAAPATLAPRAGGCRPGPNTLCLNDGRFAVEVEFDPPNGRAAEARIFGLTGDTGAFRFFNPENLELLVKVLDACASPFNSFWVFAAGLTNVEVALTVTDTQTGAVKRYTNPQGRPFVPIQDTSAFKTCP